MAREKRKKRLLLGDAFVLGMLCIHSTNSTNSINVINKSKHGRKRERYANEHDRRAKDKEQRHGRFKLHISCYAGLCRGINTNIVCFVDVSIFCRVTNIDSNTVKLMEHFSAQIRRTIRHCVLHYRQRERKRWNVACIQRICLCVCA